MKSVSQVLEKRVHQIARRKVRSSVQPGVVWNILESEISSVLTEIIQERLRQEQNQALDRQVYERSRDHRRRNGFKRVRLGGLLHGLWVKKPVLLRGTLPSALLNPSGTSATGSSPPCANYETGGNPFTLRRWLSTRPNRIFFSGLWISPPPSGLRFAQQI